jgi:hypothetical protein
LEDQKKLLADPNYARIVKRWERKEGGEKVFLERPFAHFEVVAARPKRRVRDDHEGRIETHRVRTRFAEIRIARAESCDGDLIRMGAAGRAWTLCAPKGR